MLQEPNTSYLKQLAYVEERPFTSHMPMLGTVIIKLRTWWNNIATTWYVRPLLTQQNEFNSKMVQTIEQQEQRLIAQDQEKVDLTREVSRLTTQILALNQQIQSLEARLAGLEKKTQ